MDTNALLSERARAIDASGIRRIFDLASKLTDPINLSIGQPDFAVPGAVCDAAVDAIRAGLNGYTSTQGHPPLLARTVEHLRADLGWEASASGTPGDGPKVLETTGTSGALTLAFLSLLSPGDECVIPDPYFVSYPHLATMAGARAVPCETYPDFRLTAERVEPLLNERTKFVLVNSPANPTGVVMSKDDCDGLRELCARRGVLLVSDEIYDEFTYPSARTDAFAGDPGRACCPSAARVAKGGAPGAHEGVLVIRGFGKSYGCTGWRLGYAAGPAPVIEAMARLQQYTFVCAPTPLQAGVVAAFDADITPQVLAYQERRDTVLDRLGAVTEVTEPGGAFYAFVRVPERLGMSGTRFVERAVERGVLVIPGGVFSSRDTHFRVSFATAPDRLARGLDVLCELMGG